MKNQQILAQNLKTKTWNAQDNTENKIRQYNPWRAVCSHHFLLLVEPLFLTDRLPPRRLNPQKRLLQGISRSPLRRELLENINMFGFGGEHKHSWIWWKTTTFLGTVENTNQKTTSRVFAPKGSPLHISICFSRFPSVGENNFRIKIWVFKTSLRRFGIHADFRMYANNLCTCVRGLLLMCVKHEKAAPHNKPTLTISLKKHPPT